MILIALISNNYHNGCFVSPSLMLLLLLLMVLDQGIQMTTRKKLCNIKGISEAKVDKIKVNYQLD